MPNGKNYVATENILVLSIIDCDKLTLWYMYGSNRNAVRKIKENIMIIPA